MPPTKIKAVFFDFMGTCLDWHTSVGRSMSSFASQEEASKLALDWRRDYFLANQARLQQKLPPQDIDLTLLEVLNSVLGAHPELSAKIDSATKQEMISAWHSQLAWPEVQGALTFLKEDLGLEVFVHANGTTRLQLDLIKSSSLRFDMLFSSQLLGTYKPDPEAYRKALLLVKLQPEEVALVAAHAYDLRGAQACGMRTVYVHRWTDDVDEDMERVKLEFDAFLEDMEKLPETIAGMNRDL